VSLAIRLVKTFAAGHGGQVKEYGKQGQDHSDFNAMQRRDSFG